jgi:hypothetical protein
MESDHRPIVDKTPNTIAGIDRKNHLQISTLLAVRAMWTILCEVQSRRALLSHQVSIRWPQRRGPGRKDKPSRWLV